MWGADGPSDPDLRTKVASEGRSGPRGRGSRLVTFLVLDEVSDESDKVFYCEYRVDFVSNRVGYTSQPLVTVGSTVS